MKLFKRILDMLFGNRTKLEEDIITQYIDGDRAVLHGRPTISVRELMKL